MTKMKLMFVLSSDSDFDTDYVTKKVGTLPTSVVRKNDPDSSPPYRDFTEWVVSTDYICDDTVTPLLSQLRQKIVCSPHTLRELADECNADWYIVFDGYTYSGNAPFVYLSDEFVDFCAEIQAKVMFNFDISCDYCN